MVYLSGIHEPNWGPSMQVVWGITRCNLATLGNSWVVFCALANDRCSTA
jgi:hypothetical protein